MPPFTEIPRKYDEQHLFLTEVGDEGAIDLGRLANGLAQVASIKLHTMRHLDRAVTIAVEVDTGEHEHPPTFTIELHGEGPRLYLHGTTGELAVTLTVTKDGSVSIENHQP